MDESGIDGAEHIRKVARGRKVVVTTRSFVNFAISLQLECVRMLHESLLVPVLM